uniref:Pept_C1 domain-containing protein n=1 Tax=Meloidogyne hapla TaxID=6305 RepID=A0A1I8BXW2_MELHA
MNNLFIIFFILQLTLIASFGSSDLLTIIGNVFDGKLNEEEARKLAQEISLIKEVYDIDINEEQIRKIADDVAQINAQNGGFWNAKVNYHSLLPENEQKRICGVGNNERRIKGEGNGTKTEFPIFEKLSSTEDCTIEIEFDVRDAWPDCVYFFNYIQNQGRCGSCWAVSTASAYTDRVCIERSKNGITTPSDDPFYHFSSTDVMSCSIDYDGCEGGWPSKAWQWIEINGLCTGTDNVWKNGCKPYPYAPKENAQQVQCESKCNENWNTEYSEDKKFANSAAFLINDNATEEAIKEELQTNGPLVAAFMVYKDFMSYKSGKTPNSTEIGGHAVVILGYGTQKCNGKEMPFWIVKNSWGTDWGDEGFFKIRRGGNECGFEKDEISFGIPTVL